MAVNPQQQLQQQRNWGQYLRGQFNNIQQSISGITGTGTIGTSGTIGTIGTTVPRMNNMRTQQASSFNPFGFGATSTAAAMGTTGIMGMQNGIGRILAYVIGIIIVVIVLSLLIHYYVTPIYSLQPGAPGIISVPGFDDGIIFWDGSGKYPAMGVIKNDDLPIKSAYCDYSLIVDMFIQNPLQFSQYSRILLKRGDPTSIKATPTSKEIIGAMSNYNLVVALQPDTTDMVVSVMNAGGGMENVIIENIPVQEPFRLGIVVMQNALEVYINGFLMKTRKINNGLKDVGGDLAPASNSELSIAKMQNLKIWTRILSTPEIREAKPALASATSFNALAIPSSTSCTN
jgi:uncharacterized membrane protein YtjA (UPF0391 family)